MKKIIFDFKLLADRNAFYQSFALKFQLSDDFGANLDALWDVLTGEIELPVKVVFRHFPEHSPCFEPIMQIMQEAENELGKANFRFSCEYQNQK